MDQTELVSSMARRIKATKDAKTFATKYIRSFLFLKRKVPEEKAPKAKLENEIKKNKSLEKELDKLRCEIAEVKSRNKTLYGILGHGEMKEKADVLLELERLNIVKNELTDEVSKLHGLLEQERSKVANLTADLNHQNKYKEKKKKQHAV